MPDGGFIHPFAPQARQDPYPSYAWLAEHEPLHDDEITGAVLLTRYADCDALLRHRGVSTAQADRGTRLPPSMLTSDPPAHTRLRAIGTRLISPASVEAARPGIASDIDAVLDEVGTTFDAYDDVGLPLATRVLGRLLDVPDDEHAQFGRLALAASVNLDPMSAGPEGGRAAGMLAFYLRSRLSVSDVLIRWTSDAECTDAEAIGVLSLCVIGGLEPLAAVVAAALLEVAYSGTPDAARTVEDVLRRHTPIPVVARAVHADVVLPSGTVPAGRRVLALLDAANHDTTDRGSTASDTDHDAGGVLRNLSFGAGPHFCLGAPLVRAVVSTLVARCAASSIAAVDEPRSWAPSLIPRRLHPIHLRWDATAAPERR